MGSDRDFVRAKSGIKSLSGADLSELDMRGIDLSGADLRDSLIWGSLLSGADLSGADLSGSNASGADLSDADLSNANMREADFSECEMPGADLSGASADGADLFGANLKRSSMRGASFVGATLSFADLSESDLSGANLEKSNLSRSSVNGAKFVDANLTRANLSYADAKSSDITGADIQGVITTGADFSDAVASKSKLVFRGRTYGSMTDAVLALQAVGAQSASSFKRRHPRQFDKIKHMARGSVIDDATIHSVASGSLGPKWYGTSRSYRSSDQRLCQSANEVLMLNLDKSDAGLSEEQSAALSRLQNSSHFGGHPREQSKGLFTVGWVRLCAGSNSLLVEEVQSDVSKLQQKSKVASFMKDLREDVGDTDLLFSAVRAIQPWVDRFYEDALGVVFRLARRRGAKSVEMLTHKSKEEVARGTPRSIYEDLPKSMGMTRRAASSVLEGHPAWEYVVVRAEGSAEG